MFLESGGTSYAVAHGNGEPDVLDYLVIHFPFASGGQDQVVGDGFAVSTGLDQIERGARGSQARGRVFRW